MAPTAPFLGSPNAPYTLLEFGDYQCPTCRVMAPKVAQACKQYASPLRFEFRQLPLPIRKYARRAALMAEAARVKGNFWSVHTKLYETLLTSEELSQFQLAQTAIC